MNAPLPRTRYRIPDATRQAIMRAVRRGLEPLKADPPMPLADWAVKHFRLTADSSHTEGEWESWPFQIGWLDAMSNDDIEQMDVRKAKRTGYTKCAVAFVGYNAAHRRRKVGVYQPTDDDRDSFVKSEIDPMIAACKVVARARRANGAEDTLKFKAFRGSVQHYLGAKAARVFRRITLAVVIMDEVDAMDQVVEKSINPVQGARGRLEGAPFPKFVLGTTPRLKGFSHIEREELAADVRMRFRIACPHCSEEHPLIWGDKNLAHGFKWDSDAEKPENTVRHVCPHCRRSIVQADYLQVWKDGTWVCDRTGIRYGRDRTWRTHDGAPMRRAPRHVAFVGLWAAYSPQRSWPDIVREAREAYKAHKGGDNGPLQTFTNETLAETFEEEYEQSDADALRKRARAEGLPLGIVPRGAAVLKQAVDVQADRWEVVVWAFGPDDEAWAIDYQVIYGDTADQAEWDAKLEPRIGITYPTAIGRRLATSAMAVDTGFRTHQAYAFARKHKHRQVHAVKGDSQAGKPIKSRRTMQDIRTTGRVIRKGVALWYVGTDTAKDLIHGRLQLEGSGHGRMHFAADLPEEFFRGLTAEQRIPVRTVRGVEHRWECPSGRRNEPLDCTVYCLFLAELGDLPRWTSAQWQRARDALEPDLFDAPAVVMAAASPAPVQTPAPKHPRPAPPVQPLGSDEWHSRL